VELLEQADMKGAAQLGAMW
jgi:hypothetical protein